jgi:hypothetical protein
VASPYSDRRVLKPRVRSQRHEVTPKVANWSKEEATLHELSISMALAKASKATESSQETPPPTESISESPKVMEIHTD